MSKNSQARFHNVKAAYQFCIVEEYLIHFLFGLIGRCRTRCAERMVWVAGGGVLGIVPMAGRLASAAATQRRAVTLNVTRDRASPTQRPPIPLARAASLGSPASGAMAAPASGRSTAAVAQTEGGPTGAASMAAMAGRGKGGNELELRGVGFGDEVGQIVGGAWRRTISPGHLAGRSAR